VAKSLTVNLRVPDPAVSRVGVFCDLSSTYRIDSDHGIAGLSETPDPFKPKGRAPGKANPVTRR
jgi:hypothetical protein